jgi:hypothetical protein
VFALTDGRLFIEDLAVAPGTSALLPLFGHRDGRFSQTPAANPPPVETRRLRSRVRYGRANGVAAPLSAALLSDPTSFASPTLSTACAPRPPSTLRRTPRDCSLVLHCLNASPTCCVCSPGWPPRGASPRQPHWQCWLALSWAASRGVGPRAQVASPVRSSNGLHALPVPGQQQQHPTKPAMYRCPRPDLADWSRPHFSASFLLLISPPLVQYSSKTRCISYNILQIYR